MDISLQRRFFSSFKTIGSAKKVCDINSDVVVPDTKKDILRVVLTNADYMIRSKDVESGRVLVRGELKVSILYVPESGEGLCTLATDIPFECEFEVESADSGCTAIAEMNLISVDTRILNPRKVMINAQVCVSQKCYCNSDFTWYTDPLDSINNAFFKKNDTDIRFVNLVTEKTISIEDEIPVRDLDGEVQLISTPVSFFTDSADAVGSKFIVKGHAEITANYLADGKFENCGTTISFSQIFELPERDILPDYKAFILPTGNFFELSDGKLSFEIHAVIQIVCTETKKLVYIEDGYVCGAETLLGKEEKDVCVSERIMRLSETVQLSRSAEYGIEKILFLSGMTGMPKVSGEEISVPIAVEIVYTSTDDQIRSFKVYGSAKISAEIAENETIEGTYASITSLKPSVSGMDVTVDASINIEAHLQVRSKVQFVCSAEYNEPDDRKAMPSIYMCRSEESDIWGIAKKYSSNVDMIKKINEIDHTTDTSNRLLVIPRIK